MLISHTTRNLVIDRLRRLFGGKPCRIQVAALPWREKEQGVEVMLITSRDTGRWVLPKGWAKKREMHAEAAAREAVEEAGIMGDIARDEIGRYFYDKLRSEGPAWRCRVSVFPLRVEHEAETWPEKKQRTRRWFSADEAAGLVNEPDLGELIRRFGHDPRRIAA
jgi:8-oxo-dGTP pyrophosphatase MutT (NUDIX family)